MVLASTTLKPNMTFDDVDDDRLEIASLLRQSVE